MFERTPSVPPDPRSHRRHRRLMRSRGAILIVALLLAALIAVGLGSYINLNLSTSRMARRSFNGYAALNLAEAGTEEAVWSFNRTQRGDADAWSQWQNNGVAAWQKLPEFDLGQNTRGSVKVYVDSFNPASNARPKVVAQAQVGVTGEQPVTKMIEVTLRRRSLFASGIVAKDTVVFSGAVSSVDSWNSDPDDNPATAAVAYDRSLRRDRGTVASASIVNSSVLINQADIWGYVATGGGQPEVGTNGSIRGANTPAGVKIDPAKISTDFNADFDLIAAPTDGTPLLTCPAVLGVAGTKTRWRIPSITLKATETLTIVGDVTIILTAGPGTNAIDVTGLAQIILAPGAKLTVFVAGNVKIAGQGLANPNIPPISCQIYGVSTSPGGQTLDIVGNGSLTTVVYAPNGDVTINGNGAVNGSVVANKVKFTGNADFHYDESLAAQDSNEPFAIAKWRELTSEADRSRYQSVFDGLVK